MKNMKKSQKEEMFDKTIESYNQNISQVYKFKFDKKEREMFLNLMQDYSDQQNKELLYEQKVLVNNILKLTEVGQELLSQIDELLKAVETTIIGMNWDKENNPEHFDKADDEHLEILEELIKKYKP